jgi:ABC-type Na+ transport system ATPase subunit NatA
MLCGIIPPTSGTGTVAGLDIRTQSEQIKERIGYMSQRFSLYEDLTVSENIEFYAGVYGVSTEQLAERKRWVLQMAGLEGREHSLTGELSVGWKQRLALGCAIVHEPEVLFLDEPTSGVDPISRRRFWELIDTLAEGGVTVFVTTHYMDEAEHCDRICLIYRGRIVAMGSPAELKTRYSSGVLIEVEVEPQMPALESLLSDPAVYDAAVFLFASMSIGLLISVVARSQLVAFIAAMLGTLLPSVLLSGFMFPISAMPQVLQYLTYLIPARYFIVILRGIFLKGLGGEALWKPALSLVVFGIVALVLSTRRFRKRL